VCTEKRERVRACTVCLERLSPKRLGLVVRAICVTRGTGDIARVASVNDHRVVPRSEAMREVACFTCAHGIRNRSV
jgi:hypothetical protein